MKDRAGNVIKGGLRGLFASSIRVNMLPAGLVFHCASCHVVIPADAPRPEGGDCDWVRRNRMAPFKPEETLAGQFAMAAAAWGLIYHHVLKAEAHPESAEYHRAFRHERKAHFASSAMRQALTPEQVQRELDLQTGSDGPAIRAKRDAWLYTE